MDRTFAMLLGLGLGVGGYYYFTRLHDGALPSLPFNLTSAKGCAYG